MLSFGVVIAVVVVVRVPSPGGSDEVIFKPGGADKAIDGVISLASKWTSQGTAEPHWLALELDQVHDVNGFVVRLPSMANELSAFNAIDVEFQVGSSLSGPWSTVETASNTLQHDRIIATFASREAAQFVRLLINDAGIDSHARIPEFEVYAGPAVPATLTGFTTN